MSNTQIDFLESAILLKESSICDLKEALSFTSLQNQYDIDKLYERFIKLDQKYKIDGLVPIKDFTQLSKSEKIKISSYLNIKRIGKTMIKNTAIGAGSGFISGVVGTELVRVYGQKAIDVITHDGKNKPKNKQSNNIKNVINDNIIPRSKGDIQNGLILSLGGGIIGAGKGAKNIIKNDDGVENIEVRVKDRDIFIQKDKLNRISIILLLYRKRKNNKIVIKVFKT